MWWPNITQQRNGVAVALSCKLKILVASLFVREWWLLEQLSDLNVEIRIDGPKVVISSIQVQQMLLRELKWLNRRFLHFFTYMECEKENKADFYIRSDGIPCYQDRVCFPTDETLKKRYWKRHIVANTLFIPKIEWCIKICMTIIGGMTWKERYASLFLEA